MTLINWNCNKVCLFLLKLINAGQKVSTCFTITASPNGQIPSGDVASKASDREAPTAEEIALIREVYPFIKTKQIFVRVVTEYIHLIGTFDNFNSLYNIIWIIAVISCTILMCNCYCLSRSPACPWSSWRTTLNSNSKLMPTFCWPLTLSSTIWTTSAIWRTISVDWITTGDPSGTSPTSMNNNSWM